jgi:hypothetical protein
VYAAVGTVVSGMFIVLMVLFGVPGCVFSRGRIDVVNIKFLSPRPVLALMLLAYAGCVARTGGGARGAEFPESLKNIFLKRGCDGGFLGVPALEGAGGVDDGRFCMVYTMHIFYRPDLYTAASCSEPTMIGRLSIGVYFRDKVVSA